MQTNESGMIVLFIALNKKEKLFFKNIEVFLQEVMSGSFTILGGFGAIQWIFILAKNETD